MAASVGLTLLLPLPRFPFCERLPERVTVRAPVPPAAVGLPTPSLYWVSFALRVRGGGTGGNSGSEGAADCRSVPGSSVSALSSSVSCMITDELEVPLNRVPTPEREAYLVEGARCGGGGGVGRAACVVSTRSSINASVFRLALMP